MAILNLRRADTGAGPVAYALERGAAPGTYYNFAGPAVGTFTAGPLGADQLRALAADPDPAFAGRLADDFDCDPAVFVPGTYLVSIDAAAAPFAYLGDLAVELAGSGPGGAATPGDVASAVWLRDVDGVRADQAVRLIAAFAAGDLGRDQDGTLRFRALDGSADRIVATRSANARTNVRNPGP
jgi:hypothetical protein